MSEESPTNWGFRNYRINLYRPMVGMICSCEDVSDRRINIAKHRALSRKVWKLPKSPAAPGGQAKAAVPTFSDHGLQALRLGSFDAEEFGLLRVCWLVCSGLWKQD